MILDVLLQVALGDTFDIFSRSKNSPSQWSSLISCRVKMIEHDFLQIGLHLLHFPQNHTSFPLNLTLAELRITNNVAEDLDGLWHVLGEAFGVEHGLLSTSVSVQMGTHILYFQLEISLRPLCRSLNKSRL